VGNEDKTELTISSLPPWVRNMAMLISLLFTLCTKGKHSCIVGFELLRGKPKLVKGKDIATQLNVAI
jgi:hypothetical protein